jgi:hypothetical protein
VCGAAPGHLPEHERLQGDLRGKRRDAMVTA